MTEQKPRRAPRPKNAATLILVRRRKNEPLVLMGQRHSGHQFMPNKFVFPGGRVDLADHYIRPIKDFRAPVRRKVEIGAAPRLARALGMAALRETYEEAGLLVGEPRRETARTSSRAWSDFLQHGVAPRLDILEFIGRAITPPYRNRRFDARFFMVDAEHIHGDVHDTSMASGELLEIHWVPVREAQKLDLPNITHRMIDEIDFRLRADEEKIKRHKAPFFRFVHGKPVYEEI